MGHTPALIFTHIDRARVLQKNITWGTEISYSITIMNENLTDGVEISVPNEFPLSDETLVSIAQDYLDAVYANTPENRTSDLVPVNVPAGGPKINAHGDMISVSHWD